MRAAGQAAAVSGRDRRLSALESRLGRLRVPRQIEERFGRYRGDPVGFCREVLGAESAMRRSDGTPYQFQILADLVTHPRVAVRSGHGVGKSAIDAWAACWWLLTRPMSRVICLAPEYTRQIRAILFSELRKWVRRSRVPLPLEVLASRALVTGYGEEWSASGMSTAGDPDRIEGFHASGGVLVICDETKGIPQDAFDAVQGALSGLEEARLLVTSTPGGAGSGPFWNACVRDAARWHVYHLPSPDSSLVSPEWVADRARDWGEGSPLYQTRVLGEFADAGEGVLFPLGLVDAAMTRTPVAGGAQALGVDVARSIAGDLNSVARCADGQLDVLRSWRSPDLMATVQKCVQLVAETGVRRLAVDVGGPGGGVADRLTELGYAVEAVHFGGSATEPERFKNRRAELFWKLREALERGTVALAEDDDVRADLSALRYEFAADGRIVIEGKDEVRRRLGRSPDRGDALALALSAATGAASPILAALVAEAVTDAIAPLFPESSRQDAPGATIATRVVSQAGGN
jgi:hypothetical protein